LAHFSGASRRDTASGDYLDRGPDSCAPDFSAVVEFIIKRGEAHQLVALRGKHEIMMLDAREKDSVYSATGKRKRRIPLIQRNLQACLCI